MLWVLGGLASLVGVGYLFDSTIGQKALKNEYKADKADKKFEGAKTSVKSFNWLGIVFLPLVLIGVTVGVAWYFLKKKGPDTPTTRALFNAGYMGIDLSDELKKSESYLAGMAKRLKEDRRDEQMGKLGAKLGGLDVKHITAEYGKKTYYNNEGYHSARNY